MKWNHYGANSVARKGIQADTSARLSGGATRQPDSLRSTGQRLKPFDVGNTIRYRKLLKLRQEEAHPLRGREIKGAEERKIVGSG